MDMESQEQIPASLPDTQNVDTLTQSQEVSSQQTTLTIWGRLCATRPLLPNLDLKDTSYTVGRAENCDIYLTTKELRPRILNVISKVHFRIYRESICNMNEAVVYLEDLSHNGTFVDDHLVGHGKRVIIENNSKIALARSDFGVYIFMTTNLETPCELPLELKQKYASGRRLGAGACGEVRMLFTKDGSEKFAIKIIQKNYFSTDNGNIFNNPMNVRNEVEILRKLRHPCIIYLIDIYDTPRAMYIILELMEGGELFDKIKSTGKLSEPCAKMIFYQIVLAVHYLHKEGITHRDLKLENILLKDNSDYPLVKVSDFGLSKFVDTQTMMKTFCGTPMYVAPEILSTHGRSSYTKQVDVWSLGVILYICVSGTTPFHSNNLVEEITRGLYEFRSSHFQHVPENVIKLIKRMMTVNPRERITVPQILLNPWLRDIRMRQEVNRLISNNNVENNENVPPLNVCNKRPRIMV
ncbi:serine/threonine-protein kinase Chk2 [Monomorium pharaonis]|uniref:serine/threonine-protein kinase Chk2 n=1 Tax=Monomorium pharaonis TaxID=307658 RepID=UPI00063F96D2|nr:serine/threonine-protein kinase Chk2 [Monomorium pharaonis]